MSSKDLWNVYDPKSKVSVFVIFCPLISPVRRLTSTLSNNWKRPTTGRARHKTKPNNEQRTPQLRSKNLEDPGILVCRQSIIVHSLDSEPWAIHPHHPAAAAAIAPAIAIAIAAAAALSRAHWGSTRSSFQARSSSSSFCSSCTSYCHEACVCNILADIPNDMRGVLVLVAKVEAASAALEEW